MKFKVRIGMLVRKVADVVVEAKSREDLESRLDEVYRDYDDSNWKYDDDWGCEESECHFILGEAKESDEVEMDLTEDAEWEDDDA